MPYTTTLTRNEIQRLKNIIRSAIFTKADDILEADNIWDVINELHELRKIYDFTKQLVSFEDEPVTPPLTPQEDSSADFT